MTSEERAILTECLTRQQEIAKRPEPAAGRKWDLLELIELLEHGPRFSVPAWFGDEDGYIPERFRSRYLRAVWTLVAAGLVIPTRTGARLTNIRLSDAGEQRATELAALAAAGGEG